ncbi:alpha/beta hydrolase [Clostridium sp. MCC353]|uniref:alpha/beta hydrolase n=1 Tax=Clostridium sp. MCC353 TaxID=2592646 RepID=UPI001C036C4C|nr:alpha/beta hydrolase [Clostridium sp. MCC353]
MKMTKEEKIEWARKLRQPSNLPFEAPENYLGCLNDVSEKTLMIPTSVGDSTCYLFEKNSGAVNDVLFVNIHGGGFVQLHNLFDRALCATYALELGCRVLDIDYRVAPESPFPIPVIECYEVIQWVLNHGEKLGINPDKVIVGGNSAGATLTASACIMAQEKGGKVPAMTLLIYPGADSFLSPEESCILNDGEEPDLSDLRVRGVLYNTLYTDNDPSLAGSPYVNLGLATEEQLAKFPDTLVITAGKDYLRYGGERFAGLLAASGSKIILQRFKNSDHGFYVRCMGTEWRDARELAMNTICAKFGLKRIKTPELNADSNQ